MKSFTPTMTLPGFHDARTYAAHPVWKGSTTADVKFVPLAADAALSRKAAARLFHRLRDFERQTAITRRDAFGKVSTQGKIGRMGLLVAHALFFDFLNHRSGRLDPSIQAIADKACVSVRSVFRALARLRAAGVFSWVKRCTGRMIDGHFTLEQDTNAYGINPEGHWQGYKPPPPPPDPATWGATPPLPAFGIQPGDGPARMLAALEGGDLLAQAAARCWRLSRRPVP